MGEKCGKILKRKDISQLLNSRFTEAHRIVYAGAHEIMADY